MFMVSSVYSATNGLIFSTVDDFCFLHILYFYPFIQLTAVMEETTACPKVGSVITLPIVEMEQTRKDVSTVIKKAHKLV